MDRRTAPGAAPRARIYIAVFLTFVAAIVIVGRTTYRTQLFQFEVDLRRQIDGIAGLKARHA
jgi:hypothetical protein